MKHILFVTLLFIVSCNSDSQKDNSKATVHDVTWPESTVYQSKDNTFSIKLSSDFGKINAHTIDTVETVYGKAIQHQYSSSSEALKLIISRNIYDIEVFKKQPLDEILESSLNTFLHALSANKTQSMNTDKTINGIICKGTRTFYTFTDQNIVYYGCSEMYCIPPVFYHVCIISTSKDSFAGNTPAGLAFTSFTPNNPDYSSKN